MLRRRVLSVLATGAAASVALPARAQGDKPLVLGQSCPQTGPAAQLGQQMQRGAKLYFDRLNAQGGVNGRKIELRTLDDGYEPERCRANTETLLLKDEVFALFGYVGTPTSLAALPLAQAAKVPFFAPFTGAEALRDPFSRLVFHVRASYFDETALIVRQLTHLHQAKIAVFRQNDSYGQAGLDGVVRALKAQQLAPVAVGLVERNSTDVAAAVAAIVPKAPHAVVQIGAYKGCAAFIREARKAGYGGTFYNVSFVGTQALAQELGADARGVVVTQVMPYPFGTVSGVAREFQDAAKAAGANVAGPDYTSIEGFVAAKVFAEGLRRAGRNPSRENFIDALEGLQSYDVGGYRISYGRNDHRGSSFAEVSMLTGDGKVRR